MIFRTKNSTYEVDLEARRIRLVSSTKPHPERRHEWRFYYAILGPVKGDRVHVGWRRNGPATTTTEVQEVGK